MPNPNVLLRRFGLKLKRYTCQSDAMLSLMTAMKSLGVQAVVDVGANTGQFGAELRDVGFRGPIVSFEPLSDAHAALLERARRDQGWIVAPRAAAGDASGEVTINVSENSQSSSLLPMLPAHEAAAPDSIFVRTETTPLIRLDDSRDLQTLEERRLLLKIDTQGSELAVLRGAEALLERVVLLTVELSFQPLYGGAPEWRSLIEALESRGFEFWSLHPMFTDEQTGRTLQADAVFARPAAQ